MVVNRRTSTMMSQAYHVKPLKSMVARQFVQYGGIGHTIKWANPCGQGHEGH